MAWFIVEFNCLFQNYIDLGSSFLIELFQGSHACVKIAMSDLASGILCGFHSNFLLKDWNNQASS